MAKVVVPLAGPDFELPDGSVKAEQLHGGLPLLRCALEQRPWHRLGQTSQTDLIFVLRDTAPSRRFAEMKLRRWYPKARVVTTSATAQGAAFSALAGLALVGEDKGPLIVDLADILFACNGDPVAAFDRRSNLAGLLLTFPSRNPKYSFIEVDIAGSVVMTAEKQVISGLASAGVYLFRNVQTYLRALAHNLDRSDEVKFRDLFYVCPIFNGVIGIGVDVATHDVTDVVDVK